MAGDLSGDDRQGAYDFRAGGNATSRACPLESCPAYGSVEAARQRFLSTVVTNAGTIFSSEAGVSLIPAFSKAIGRVSIATRRMAESGVCRSLFDQGECQFCQASSYLSVVEPFFDLLDSDDISQQDHPNGPTLVDHGPMQTSGSSQ